MIVLFNSMGLVQIMRDDKNIDIEFISHLTAPDVDDFLNCRCEH
jgi:hypothetical protein